jgi:hypothetical protein
MRSGERKRLDLAGVALSTLAILPLMLPLIEGPERGWAGWPVAMLVASPVAFVGFYVYQRRIEQRPGQRWPQDNSITAPNTASSGD